ncbi:MAG: TlpA family protein disulfide reductase [Firmicutes bacterium]|nr:TlpA family protein disulfide reductase [Bacillota bacterium]
MAVIAVLVGSYALARTLRAHVPNEADAITEAAWYALLGALLGGRFLNQVLTTDIDWTHPLTLLKVTGLSLSFTGALAGGCLAAAVALRRRGLPPAEGLDWIAAPLSLALAIGWLGVPVTGPLTTMPWGWPSAPGIRTHPVQIYGALGFLALAAYLWRQQRQRDYAGQNALTFVILASAFRMLLGFYESNAPVYGRWTLTQLGDAATLLWGTVWAVRLQWPAPGKPQSEVRSPLKRTGWVILGVLLVTTAFLGFTTPSTVARNGQSGPYVGLLAPDFTLPTPDGRSVTLSSLRGEPVWIHFWATWCPPCRQEMPEIERFYKEHDGKVRILGVNLAEPPATIVNFTRQLGYSWTFLLDRDASVSRLYKVRFIPTSFFVDKNGVIRVIYSGPMNLNQIRSFWRQAGGR